jgi:hypothetical protein
MHNLLIHDNDPVDIYTWLNELEDDEFSDIDDPGRVPPKETLLHNSVPLGAHKQTKREQLKVYICETFIHLYNYNTTSGGVDSSREDSNDNEPYPWF